MKTIFKGAHIISLRDELDLHGDMIIEDGKIAQIGHNLSEDGITHRYDAGGLCLAPGLVDLYACATEPDDGERECVHSLSRAAAKGGYTAVCAHTRAGKLAEVSHIRRLSEYAYCDIIPAARATNGKTLLSHGELKLAGAGLLYDPDPIIDPLLMRNALYRARKHDIPLMTRCRDDRLAPEGLMREGVRASLYEMPVIPASVESTMVARDVLLAQESGSAVHIAHISTATSVEVLRIAKQAGVKVTASTEPQYLTLTSAELSGYNTLAKLDPPLGNPEDVRAVAYGLRDGIIDCIASGHTPVLRSEKVKSLVTAGCGASLLETALSAALTGLYHTGIMDLARVLDRMSGAPAQLLGRKPGRIAVGEDADLVLFDPHVEWTCRGANFASRSKSTPFEGHVLKGRVRGTIKAGRVLVWEGELK